MNKLYIVEPRHIDGSYNAKQKIPLEKMITGITENELFDWYFHMTKQQESADWTQVVDYLLSLWLVARVKTW